MTMLVQKATPVLFVDHIEPAIAFWEKLGFRKTIEVPGEHGLGFCGLSNGSVELMYQTFTSLAEDMPELAKQAAGLKTFLFVEVPSLTEVEQACAGQPVFLPRRKTFYGALETGFVEPGGHFVTFAEFGKAD